MKENTPATINCLKEMIDCTNELDHEEKQWWLDLLPEMTELDMQRLFDILYKEEKPKNFAKQMILNFWKDKKKLRNYKQLLKYCIKQDTYVARPIPNRTGNELNVSVLTNWELVISNFEI